MSKSVVYFVQPPNNWQGEISNIFSQMFVMFCLIMNDFLRGSSSMNELVRLHARAPNPESDSVEGWLGEGSTG